MKSLPIFLILLFSILGKPAFSQDCYCFGSDQIIIVDASFDEREADGNIFFSGKCVDMVRAYVIKDGKEVEEKHLRCKSANRESFKVNKNFELSGSNEKDLEKKIDTIINLLSEYVFQITLNKQYEIERIATLFPYQGNNMQYEYVQDVDSAREAVDTIWSEAKPKKAQLTNDGSDATVIAQAKIMAGCWLIGKYKCHKKLLLKVTDSKRSYFKTSSGSKENEDQTTRRTLKNRAKKNLKESAAKAKKKKFNWPDYSLDSVLVFEDFGFDTTDFEPDGYQVYYFLKNKKTNKKFIAEGDMYLTYAKELLSADIDAIHPASTLKEYIGVREKEDCIISHPEGVDIYTSKQNDFLEK